MQYLLDATNARHKTLKSKIRITSNTQADNTENYLTNLYKQRVTKDLLQRLGLV